jgi:hypothetical protein
MDQCRNLVGSRPAASGQSGVYADRGSWPGWPVVGAAVPSQGWHYLLRLSSQHTCLPQGGKLPGSWRACAELVNRRGQSWFGPATPGQDQPLAAFLSAVWEPSFREPWVLLSDLPAGRARVQAYRRRMRVESSFQDFKRRGWDIEVTVIADRARLERLLLVLFLGVW